MLKPLSGISKGRKCVIRQIRGGRGFYSRLMSMGLNVGRELEVLNSARSSGPVILLVEGSRIALGLGMADKIIVEELA